MSWPPASTLSSWAASTSGAAVCTSPATIGRRGAGMRRAKRWYHDRVSMRERESKGIRQYNQCDCTSEAVTNNVRVEVESQYAPQHSHPFLQVWLFHYTVRITNEGLERVKLLTRHWIITDAKGHVE